jgi:hypothetical protein
MPFWNVFLSRYPALLLVLMSGGFDDVMEKHGLPIDVDGSGNEVRGESTVSGESFQRAKNLTHKTQCRL